VIVRHEPIESRPTGGCFSPVAALSGLEKAKTKPKHPKRKAPKHSETLKNKEGLWFQCFGTPPCFGVCFGFCSYYFDLFQYVAGVKDDRS
jgi:hypothetical protein